MMVWSYISTALKTSKNLGWRVKQGWLERIGHGTANNVMYSSLVKTKKKHEFYNEIPNLENLDEDGGLVAF